MNYKKIHDSIISKAVSRTLEGYSEKHHITPKCLGGSNKPDNLVGLTAREHFVVHQLLVKMHPDNHSIFYAAQMMTRNATGKRFGNKEYDWLKKKCSNIMKKRWKEPKYRDHMSQVMNTTEYKRKVSANRIVGNRRFMQTEEYKKKVSEISKNIWSNPEFREKHKEALRKSRLARGLKS